MGLPVPSAVRSFSGVQVVQQDVVQQTIVSRISFQLSFMRMIQMRKVLFAAAAAMVFGIKPAAAQEPMKFFVPSTAGPALSGPRGIAGADEHCQLRGYAAGFGDFEWRAYLNVPASNGKPAQKAAERIGSGPWYNLEGDWIASNPAELTGGGHGLTRQTAVAEQGGKPFSAASTTAPEELLKTGQADSRGFYLCFAR
jgi:hypothetical protein